MTKRLDFIRKLKHDRGFTEILDSNDAEKIQIVVLGKNVKIKEGTIIGTDGFGHERNEKKQFEKFPHYGKVIIESDVDIGANCTIDRGNMSDTIIGEGTKIDNGVHISHNVKVGKHCIIGPHSVLLGSCEIGDYSTIWTNTVIGNHIKIGSNATIGACSFVNKDIPSNCTAFGIPAKVTESNNNSS